MDYDSLKDLVQDSTITDAVADKILNQARKLLVTFGATISAPTGVAGGYTWTVTDAQEGAIVELAVEIYSKDYKSAGASANAVGIGGLSVSTQSSTGGGASGLLEYAKMLATRLKTAAVTDSPPIWLSNDPVPTES